MDPSLPAPSQLSLRRELNHLKREQFPWMYESTKCAPQEAIINLGIAFKNFFEQRGKYPTRKKRGQHDSFKLSSGQFAIFGKRLRVPNIGWIRMREPLRWPDAKLVSVTISRKAGHWYASMQCELSDPEPITPARDSTVGVDVGVWEYVASDGTRWPVPRVLRSRFRSLKRAQQALSRTQKGSRNRAKARLKVARLHAYVGNARSDWLHKLTTGLADSYSHIVIEDLNVSAMVKNWRLALSVMDASFGEFRRQLAYKTQGRGTSLVIADRWFPSSKLCSHCGTKAKSLKLSEREWSCGACGTLHDRDLNAAINLARYDPAASSAVAACGALLTAVSDDLSVGTSRRDEPGTRHQRAPQFA